ncbi:hypothetical protein B0H19DRAFT_1265545 [Mycena capillaripes]|nr:hypothetical protein B0H19DRAFT_1265545 [Mycena capillaripes]
MAARLQPPGLGEIPVVVPPPAGARITPRRAHTASVSLPTQNGAPLPCPRHRPSPRQCFEILQEIQTQKGENNVVVVLLHAHVPSSQEIESCKDKKDVVELILLPASVRRIIPPPLSYPCHRAVYPVPSLLAISSSVLEQYFEIAQEM